MNLMCSYFTHFSEHRSFYLKKTGRQAVRRRTHAHTHTHSGAHTYKYTHTHTHTHTHTLGIQ